jgi:hypothetical protein
MKQSNNGKGEKPNKNKGNSNNEKSSKQGIMNPKRPFDKIVTYVEDASSGSELEQEQEQEQDSFNESDQVTPVLRAVGRETNFNIFLATLKNKGVLSGVDFCAVMAKTQGKGSKDLKGLDLKRHLSWKEQVSRNTIFINIINFNVYRK